MKFPVYIIMECPLKIHFQYFLILERCSCYFIIVSKNRQIWLLTNLTSILFIQLCFLACFVEIGCVVLEIKRHFHKFSESFNVFLLFCYYQGVVNHLPSHKNVFWHIRFKMANGFWRSRPIYKKIADTLTDKHEQKKDNWLKRKAHLRMISTFELAKTEKNSSLL